MTKKNQKIIEERKKIKIKKIMKFKGNRQSLPYSTEYELRWVDMGNFKVLNRPTKKELLQIGAHITNWVGKGNIIDLTEEVLNRKEEK